MHGSKAACCADCKVPMQALENNNTSRRQVNENSNPLSWKVENFLDNYCLYQLKKKCLKELERKIIHMILRN